MQKLVDGLHRFHTGVFRSQKELFDRLAQGQNPETLFITCSDSRINPNLLTMTKPGELFVLRNAGNIVPTFGRDTGGELATIEFAVTGLGVRDIIVCGHSHCGAMKGLFDPHKLDNMPLVAQWLIYAETTRRIVKENYPKLKGQAQVDLATRENVLVQLEHLETHPSVAVRLGRGDLKLHGWVYMIETGEVQSFDPSKGQFVSLMNQRAEKLPSFRRRRIAEI